jgi:hypothetical protein
MLVARWDFGRKQVSSQPSTGVETQVFSTTRKRLSRSSRNEDAQARPSIGSIKQEMLQEQ